VRRRIRGGPELADDGGDRRGAVGILEQAVENLARRLRGRFRGGRGGGKSAGHARGIGHRRRRLGRLGTRRIWGGGRGRSGKGGEVQRRASGLGNAERGGRNGSAGGLRRAHGIVAGDVIARGQNVAHLGEAPRPAGCPVIEDRRIGAGGVRKVIRGLDARIAGGERDQPRRAAGAEKVG